jgi:pimeloyl-ACP methyl ester carboxylesterase
LYRPIEDTLPSITAPVLVVWGDSDPFFTVDIGRRTAAAIPRATFLQLPNCGHFVPEECPHEVADAITDLIAGSAAGGMATADIAHDSARLF